MNANQQEIGLVQDETAEADAVRAARAGSTDALGELFRLYADAVLTVAYRITGSRADAEDVLQDVFVGLGRALRAYDERGRFDAWLRKVAVRTALMRLRGARRKRELPLDARQEAPAGEEARQLSRLELERALARLPEGLRIVFMLKEVEGYGHAEIAELLDITPGASMTRLSRAWSALKRAMGA